MPNNFPCLCIRAPNMPKLGHDEICGRFSKLNEKKLQLWKDSVLDGALLAVELEKVRLKPGYSAVWWIRLGRVFERYDLTWYYYLMQRQTTLCTDLAFVQQIVVDRIKHERDTFNLRLLGFFLFGLYQTSSNRKEWMERMLMFLLESTYSDLLVARENIESVESTNRKMIFLKIWEFYDRCHFDVDFYNNELVPQLRATRNFRLYLLVTFKHGVPKPDLCGWKIFFSYSKKTPFNIEFNDWFAKMPELKKRRHAATHALDRYLGSQVKPDRWTFDRV